MIEGVLGLRTSGYTNGLRGARAETARFKSDIERTLSGVGKSFGRNLLAGAAGLGLGGRVREAIEYAGTLQDTADALGLNVEELQGLRGAFAESGTTAKNFDKSVAGLVIKINAAKEGNEAAQKSFADLGITLDDLTSKPVGAILLRMADGFKAAGGDGKAFAAIVDNLGKGGHTMAAGMKEGAEGVRALAAEVKKLSAGDVGVLDAMGDQIGRAQAGGTTLMGQSITGLKHGVQAGWNWFKGEGRGRGETTATQRQISAAITAATAPKLHVERPGVTDAKQAEEAARLLNQLSHAEEARAAKQRSDIEQLGVLEARRVDTEREMAAMEAGSNDQLKKKIELIETLNAIDETRLRIEEEDMRLVSANVSHREELLKLSGETARIEKERLDQHKSEATRIAEIESEIAANVEAAHDADALRVGELKLQNAELLGQRDVLREIQNEKDKAARAHAIREMIKPPDERRADLVRRHADERNDRVMDARQRSRELNLRKNSRELVRENVPRLLQRPGDERPGGDKEIFKGAMEQTEAVLNKIHNAMMRWSPMK